MLKGKTTKQAEPLVLVGKQSGITVIPAPTPLTRLHYFDGKFLRARDLELEQNYLRRLVALSNQAGGAGVVHGFDCTLAGATLELDPGLAIDGEGRVLLLPESHSFEIDALIEASRRRFAAFLPKPLVFRSDFVECEEAVQDDSGSVADGATFYLISVCHAEALCGEEDVYGKLCAPACSTSTERPYTLEGIAVQALPLDLGTVLPSSQTSPVTLTRKHLRSRVAAAYFEDERRRVANLTSAGGLKSAAWCHGAAAEGAGCVPLALVARAGSKTIFLDAWTTRRERIEAPPRRYWAAILAMRPWDVYLAQVLQFQCQLVHCLNEAPPEDPDDPCVRAQALLRETAEHLALLIGAPAVPAGTVQPNKKATIAGAKVAMLDYSKLEDLRSRLVDFAAGSTSVPRENLLLACGFVELPSAGYLPVDPGSALTVNAQVRRFLGQSLDLRFCVVRPDFVPHAFEEAQHMDRISLLQGFDHPEDRPKVDILVPDGVLATQNGAGPGQGYVLELDFGNWLIESFEDLTPTANGMKSSALSTLAGLAVAGRATDPGPSPTETYDTILAKSFLVFGAARGEETAGGGFAFHFAGRMTSSDDAQGAQFTKNAALWLSCELRRDPFELDINEPTVLTAEAVLVETRSSKTLSLLLLLNGELTVAERERTPTMGDCLLAHLSGTLVVSRKLADNTNLRVVVNVREQFLLERKAGAGFGTSHGLQSKGFAFLPKMIAPFVAGHDWSAIGRAQFNGKWLVDDTPLEVFKGQQTVEAAALTSGHPAHDASIAALEILRAGHNDPNFAESRSRRLFPPVKSSQEGLIVKAKLPWVLFHRRRDKICALDVPPPKEVVARRFKLYQTVVERLARIAPLKKVLLEGASGGFVRSGFEVFPIAEVEFAPGLPSVVSPDDLLAQWTEMVTMSNQIVLLVFGAIAGQGSVVGEGPSLAVARLASLASLLGSATPLEKPEFELFDKVHPDLPAGGLDGSILFATLQSVCQAVYVIGSPISSSQLEKLAEVVRNSSFVDADFPRLNGFELTQVLFEEAGAIPVAGSIEAALEALQETRPDTALDAYSVLTVSVHGTTAEEQALHEARSKLLLETLQGPGLVKGVVDGGKTAFPFNCPAVSVLAELTD